ncbi:MAG TPA: response regulator transcription factor [Solirubrobacteraceae bacterium]|jgi:DNA-binding NarL/FixJ family response regulator|nr:response regulator transcription factor [Solirubrobacteraceae bacterium]
MSESISVLLAEDQTTVRAAFRVLLEAEDDIAVVGEAADGRQAVVATQTLRPDLVLMDIRMPDLDGLEATRRITGDPKLAATRVLILTTFELDEYVFGSLRAGASGFLLKGGEPQDLINAIRVIASGQSLLAPSVTRRLIEEYISGASRSPVAGAQNLDELTAREREVLVLVAEGLSNGEIAQTLQLSTLTAKTHVSRILNKLGVRDRVQLVILAYESGVV